VVQNKWYVITGGPSSGKSTLLTELAKRGHKTVPELARALIEDALSSGKSLEEIRGDEKKFQQSILKLAIKREEELQADVTTFFDRGLHDVSAYLAHHNLSLDESLEKILRTKIYQKVFLLDPLPVFHKDHARSETPEFAQSIADQLAKTYAEHGMEPVRVPVMPVADRAKFILDNLG
jgi:predicted ATPase